MLIRCVSLTLGWKPSMAGKVEDTGSSQSTRLWKSGSESQQPRPPERIAPSNATHRGARLSGHQGAEKSGFWMGCCAVSLGGSCSHVDVWSRGWDPRDLYRCSVWVWPISISRGAGFRAPSARPCCWYAAREGVAREVTANVVAEGINDVFPHGLSMGPLKELY